MPARLIAIEYDPNRTRRIALLQHADGAKRHILAPNGLLVGAESDDRTGGDIPGNALPLANMPTGTQVHNIESIAGRGGQMVRSAGVSAQLMAKKAITRCFACRAASAACASECMATIGQVGNVEHLLVKLSAKPGARVTVGEKACRYVVL